MSKTIFITTAGSGGHVQTALGLIDIFSKQDKEKLLFVGSNRSMEGEKDKKSLEQTLCEKENIDFHSIRSGKLQRTFSFKSLFMIFGFLLGFYDSFFLLRKHNPKLVFSFGGYVTLPLIIIAYLKKIPIYLHEQTSKVGLSNKIAGYFATKVFITYESSKEFFKKEKVKFVGAPKRYYVLKVNQNELSANLSKEILDKLSIMVNNKKKYPILTIIGGSLGSHLLNNNLLPLIPRLVRKYQIIMQTGDNQILKDYEKFQDLYEKLDLELKQRVFFTKFISEEMGLIYRMTDFFIGRSGANTVYELGMLNIPSILIPLSFATQNEQYYNAEVLQNLGLSTILQEKDLNPETLFNLIELKINQINRTDKEKLKKLFPKDSAERIYKEINGFF